MNIRTVKSFRSIEEKSTEIFHFFYDFTSLRAMDDNACVILVLFDLSAAFDTLDHQILLT